MPHNDRSPGEQTPTVAKYESYRHCQLLAARRQPFPHSHSIVAGGLLVMSYTTRFTPGTSLTIRVAVAPKGHREGIPVGRHEKSSVVTARSGHLVARSARRPSRPRSAPATARQTPARSGDTAPPA